jgi:ketosteroid isomerase-like protein
MRWHGALVLLACVGCTRGGGGPSPGTPVSPGCTSSTDTDLAVAAQAWQMAIDSKDVERLVSYFDVDATGFYPRSQPSLGRDAIRRDWADFFGRKDASHPVTSEKVIAASCDDLGYVIGSAQGAWTDSEGTHSFSGKMLTVWQRKSGQWRIVAQSGNIHDSPAR